METENIKPVVYFSDFWNNDTEQSFNTWTEINLPEASKEKHKKYMMFQYMMMNDIEKQNVSSNWQILYNMVK